MVLFTKENFPTSAPNILALIFQQWSTLLSSMVPATCPLYLSSPCHCYTLCREHTVVLSSYTVPRIPSLARIWNRKSIKCRGWKSNNNVNLLLWLVTHHSLKLYGGLCSYSLDPRGR
jgi:hypothetical protein